MDIHCKRTYSPAAFCSELKNVDWSSIYRQNCAEEMLNSFASIYYNTLIKHAPVKTIYKRGNQKSKNLSTDKKWITDECRALIRQKHDLHNQYKNEPTPSNRKPLQFNSQPC